MIKINGFRQIKPETTNWEIEEDIQANLSTKVLLQISSEAELRFNSTVDDITLLRSRAYNLITVFISLLGLMITLCYSDIIDVHLTDKKALIFLYVLDIALIAYFIIQLAIIVFPNKIMLKGEEPKPMNYKDMATISKEQQEEIYLFNSLRVYQEKIEYNEIILSDKNQRLESVIFLSIFLFAITLIFELIIKL